MVNLFLIHFFTQNHTLKVSYVKITGLLNIVIQIFFVHVFRQ